VIALIDADRVAKGR